MEEKEHFSLEDSLKKIRDIVGKMQATNVNFDENVHLFTEGTNLIEECRKHLDESEFLIQKIIDKDQKKQ